MKTLLLLLTAMLVAHSSQVTACGNYLPSLKSKTIAADGWRNLTSETFQFFVDEHGKEVRHGLSSQFDSAGKLVARAHYVNGKVKSGSVATIHLSCGIFASRRHFEDGKVISSEFLKGMITPGPKMVVEDGDLELEGFGFVVDRDQTLAGPIEGR